MESARHVAELGKSLMILRAVNDFPDPDSPTNPRAVPGAILTDNPFTALYTPNLDEKLTLKLDISRLPAGNTGTRPLVIQSSPPTPPSPCRQTDSPRSAYL